MQRTGNIWQTPWVRSGVAPLLFYTAATLGLTFPLVTQLGTHVAGAAYGDAFESVRLIWWTKEAILRGIHPAQQPLLLYPEGFFSTVQWAAPIAHLAGLPFALLFPPVVAYNLTFLASFVLTGYTAYLFLRELTGHNGAALLGGLIVMAFPARLGHATAGHLGLITNYWRMLFLWSLLRVFRGSGWRIAAFSGLCLGLALATYPTNSAYEAIPLLVIVGGGLAWLQRRSWRQWLGPVTVMAGVAGVLGVFFYGPLLLDSLRGGTAYLAETGVVRYSADLLAFITPSPFNPVIETLGLIPGWGWDVLGDSTIEGSAYLGLVTVLLAAIALWKRRQEAGLWLVLALVGMVFSLGPVLKVADRLVEVPVEGAESARVVLPYAFYSALPGLGMARTPGRFNLITSVGVAALAAYGWAALLQRVARLRRKTWQGGAVLGLAAVIMAEYAIFLPFPTLAAPIPHYYDELAAAAERGEVRPVLSLPADDFFTSQWLLYDQTAHHQPVIAGHVIRRSPANPAMLQLVNAAALPPVEDRFVPPMTPAEQAGIIRATGADVVVVYREFGNGAAMADYLPQLLGQPVYADARVAIFSVPEGPLPDTPAYVAQGGWEAADDGTRWVADTLTLSLYVPQEMTAYWLFEAAGWLYPRWISLEGEAQPPAAFFVREDSQVFQQAAVRLPAGFQQVRFRALDYSGQCSRLPGEPACRTAWIRTLRLRSGDEDQAVPIDFGAKMRLVQYVIATPDSAHLKLAFYWQALDQAREDYTLFVHLLDEHGDLVAQWDGPLGGLENPTSRWPQGGYLWQDVTLDLTDDTPEPGRYRLAAGLYTLPDVTRLPVASESPGASDGLLYLQDWLPQPSMDQR